MPSSKDVAHLRESSSLEFQKEWKPGAPVPVEGIYACLGCGIEIAEIVGDTLPDGELKHPLHCEGIRWQLVVAVERNDENDAG